MLRREEDSGSSGQWKETLELMERERRLAMDGDALAEMERLEQDSKDEMEVDYNMRLDIQAYQLQEDED